MTMTNNNNNNNNNKAGRNFEGDGEVYGID